jgi:hypothetical protein
LLSQDEQWAQFVPQRIEGENLPSKINLPCSFEQGNVLCGHSFSKFNGRKIARPQKSNFPAMLSHLFIQSFAKVKKFREGKEKLMFFPAIVDKSFGGNFAKRCHQPSLPRKLAGFD